MNKTLIMMIGSQGSGKTFYAERLRGFTRISQDDQGKYAHRILFDKAIADGHHVVVDRINHTLDQRLRYVTLAKGKGYTIRYMMIEADPDICIQRMLTRKDHPTIKQSSNHRKILDEFYAVFEEPLHHEYHELVRLNTTKNKLASVLDLSLLTRRYIIIGDIHGDFISFEKLLSECNYHEDDLVICVGDLVDRGPDSAKVVDWFYNAKRSYVIEGNHDNKLFRYMKGNHVRVDPITVAQFDKNDFGRLVSWMQLWPQIIKLPGHCLFAVHGAVDGGYSMQHQKKETCLYGRYFGGKGFMDEKGGRPWYNTLTGDRKIICGHMQHDNPYPHKDVICLDNKYKLQGLINGRDLKFVYK